MGVATETKFGTNVAYGGDDDAQTSNTCIVQRMHVITTLDNEKYDVHCSDSTL